MKLEKAKEILTDISQQAYFHPGDDEFKAIKLGSEAFELILTMRKNRVIAATFPLPSETKD